MQQANTDERRVYLGLSRSSREAVDLQKHTCEVMQGVGLRRGRQWQLLVGADGAFGLEDIFLSGRQLQRKHLLHIY